MNIKKAVAVLLCAIMLFSYSSAMAQTMQNRDTYSGSCGQNTFWSLDTDNGLLEISGSGEIDDYTDTETAPWYEYRSSIKSIRILDGIIRIGNFSFYQCSALKTVSLANTITSIGDSCFRECSNLASIIIPDSVIAIEKDAFYYCQRLGSVIFGNGLNSIGKTAFFCCTSLVSVVFPSSVDIIDNEAFEYCNALNRAVFQETPPSSFGNKVFNGTASDFQILYLPQYVDDWSPTGLPKWKGYNITEISNIFTIIFSGDFNSTQLVPIGWDAVLPVCDTDGEHYLFLKNGDMWLGKDIEEDTTVNVILTHGPSGKCGTISNSEINDNLAWSLDLETGVLRIAGSGQMGNFNSGTIPVAVPWANYTSDICSVIIGEGITSIGNYAFVNCENLTNVSIPEGIESIGASAFTRCLSLESIDLPDGLTSIGTLAFSNCPLLTVISIPGSIQSIGGTIFQYCYALTYIIFHGAPPASFAQQIYKPNAVLFYPSAYASQWAPNGETTYNGLNISPYPIVSFLDTYDDTILSTQEVVPLTSATAPEVPNHYGYTFSGWSGAFNHVVTDTTISTVYDPEPFPVTFTDGLGEIISVQQVPYLAAAVEPQHPVRYGYTFAGWDRDFSCIEEALTVNATWSINEYNVTFYDPVADEIISIQTVVHGGNAVTPLAPQHYGYVFMGWSESALNVTGDMTISAVYEPVLFTVTFTNGFGFCQ